MTDGTVLRRHRRWACRGKGDNHRRHACGELGPRQADVLRVALAAHPDSEGDCGIEVAAGDVAAGEIIT